MQKFHYFLVDVFTEQVFGGNQLAVFTGGHHLNDGQMQRIARELNLAETTFVMPPRNDETDFYVRIFTPALELPTAGHPTIGTAFVLAREGFIDYAADDIETIILFEEGIGSVPVKLRFTSGEAAEITMQQNVREFETSPVDRATAAMMLSIVEDGLDSRYPVEIGSAGVPFLYIPVKNLEVIRRVKLRPDLWDQHLRNSAAPQVYVFTTETEHSDSTVHCRMFAPGFDIPEDPATGIASGPLGCYLVKNGIVSDADSGSIISEQGFEIGRPSIIHIGVVRDGEIFSRVEVGGNCAAVGEGYFYEDLFD